MRVSYTDDVLESSFFFYIYASPTELFSKGTNDNMAPLYFLCFCRNPELFRLEVPPPVQEQQKKTLPQTSLHSSFSLKMSSDCLPVFLSRHSFHIIILTERERAMSYSKSGNRIRAKSDGVELSEREKGEELCVCIVYCECITLSLSLSLSSNFRVFLRVR